MRKVVFYNHFHNGDILHSKAFVLDAWHHIGTLHEKMQVAYAHNKAPDLLKDIAIDYEPLDVNLPKNAEYGYDSNTGILYINTWIGAYFGKGLPHDGECTLQFAYQMWNRLFGKLNKLFNTNIFKLQQIENYLPYVDYSRLNRTPMDRWARDESRVRKRKLLFCNGPALSGQCSYNGDMSDLIKELAFDYPDCEFITTQPIGSGFTNIYWTGNTNDVIKNPPYTDLNEISYLASYCDIIVGRNSGPFCFASTGTNLLNSNKTFYSFGVRHTDLFARNIEVPATVVFREFNSPDDTILKSDIREIIRCNQL